MFGWSLFYRSHGVIVMKCAIADHNEKLGQRDQPGSNILCRDYLFAHAALTADVPDVFFSWAFVA
jgi:hypothetical protein